MGAVEFYAHNDVSQIVCEVCGYESFKCSMEIHIEKNNEQRTMSNSWVKVECNETYKHKGRFKKKACKSLVFYQTPTHPL